MKKEIIFLKTFFKKSAPGEKFMKLTNLRTSNMSRFEVIQLIRVSIHLLVFIFRNRVSHEKKAILTTFIFDKIK